MKQKVVAGGIDHDQLELKTILEGDHEADRISELIFSVLLSPDGKSDAQKQQSKSQLSFTLGPILAYLGQGERYKQRRCYST